MKIKQARQKPTPGIGFAGVSNTVTQTQVLYWDETQGACPYDGEKVGDNTPVSDWQDDKPDSTTKDKGTK